MTFSGLTLRSFFFYRRAHALVLVGVMLAAAILVGAMLVGDSVKFSLNQSALLRLGKIQCSLETRGRFFLADLSQRLGSEMGSIITPALLFNGMALTQALPGIEPRQINNIQIMGVNHDFWELATGPAPHLTPNGIAINQKLATELKAQQGDQISIRFSKPSLMSKDAPLSAREKSDTLRATFIVESIVQDNQLGRFSLAADQQLPCTAFISLAWLQKETGLEQQANLLLAGENTNQSAEHLNQALHKVWQLADMGLTLKAAESGKLTQLECDRIFMDPSIGTTLPAWTNSVGALTYLVNSIARANADPVRETPYSFVIALSPSSKPELGLVPPEMADNEIIINRWLADQLAASPGDAIRITYFEFGTMDRFHETNRFFRIRRIAEMQEFAQERELGPDFPGLTDAGKCAEWDIGMPLQKSKVDDPANEAYWNNYRATPKAVITLKAGQDMWANRFGNLTAARFPTTALQGASLTEYLRQHLDPAESGLVFVPIRQTALKAANEALDLGQLFLGMSLFLIAASLLLTSLLFAFGIQQRSEETGLMLAVGFLPRQIRRLWIQECVLTAIFGSIVGAFMGSLYTRMMIWGLSHFWQNAVAQAEIHYHATFSTIVMGTLLSFICAMSALIFTVKRQTTRSVRALMSDDVKLVSSPHTYPECKKNKWTLRLSEGLTIAAITAVIVALALIGYASNHKPSNFALIFFIAGSLLLISLIVLTRPLLTQLARAGGNLSLLKLGLRNAGRHPSRSLTAASLLACGCFIIIAVSVMQEDFGHDALLRNSGTGGFALFGYSTLPIQADLENQEGRKRFSLDSNPDLKDAHFVSMKVRVGDDASCLNLNRSQTPTLIGVDPVEFEKRGAFQAQSYDNKLWTLLLTPLPDGVIPGLAGDANTAQWGLQKNTGVEKGDILEFQAERGGTFRVKLVGALPMPVSVFQGSILIPIWAFAAQYPSENGARMFLIDTPSGSVKTIKNALTLKLGKWGINITSTSERLKSFYRVESTYLSMFLILGGLGLLLGSAGMTIVILRNIQERRDELALLSALGYTHHQILKIVIAEYGFILGVGLVIGLTASLAAIWPGLQIPGHHFPWIPIAALICGILFLQVFWILLAIWASFRTPLLNALRNQ